MLPLNNSIALSVVTKVEHITDQFAYRMTIILQFTTSIQCIMFPIKWILNSTLPHRASIIQGFFSELDFLR